MRIHGDKKISRRTDVIPRNNYQNYVPELREDFKNICGYCGKFEEATRKGFEPDHFVPMRIDSDREKDYTNLVYCCFTCNRKKLGKWPTEDKHKQNDGLEGFVDPVSEEYDDNLGRDEQGNIIYYTNVGKYMYEKAFRFDIRPTKEIWQATKLIEAKERMYSIRNKLTVDQLKEYLEVDHTLSELLRILFEKKE